MGVPNYATTAGFAELWRRALTVEFGIAIPTNNIRWLERSLYAARKAARDPGLEAVIMMKPKAGEIWLMKKDVELGT